MIIILYYLFDLQCLRLNDFVLNMIAWIALIICNVRRAIKESNWFRSSNTEVDFALFTIDCITMDRLAMLSVEELIFIYYIYNFYIEIVIL